VAPLDIFKQLPKATVALGVFENRLLLIAPADDVVRIPLRSGREGYGHARPLAPHSDNIK